jgi:hypothetical protein
MCHCPHNLLNICVWLLVSDMKSLRDLSYDSPPSVNASRLPFSSHPESFLSDRPNVLHRIIQVPDPSIPSYIISPFLLTLLSTATPLLAPSPPPNQDSRKNALGLTFFGGPRFSSSAVTTLASFCDAVGAASIGMWTAKLPMNVSELAVCILTAPRDSRYLLVVKEPMGLWLRLWRGFRLGLVLPRLLGVLLCGCRGGVLGWRGHVLRLQALGL